MAQLLLNKLSSPPPPPPPPLARELLAVAAAATNGWPARQASHLAERASERAAGGPAATGLTDGQTVGAPTRHARLHCGPVRIDFGPWFCGN